MLNTKITLPKTGVVISTYLTDNLAVNADRKRPLVLIFPGGGYHLRARLEAEPVALKLLSFGVQAVVVEYSVAPSRYPTALKEAAEAVEYARAHAEEWFCDPSKIAVMGFSAGGHAAASIGILWERLSQGDACRPDAMILCYPVITGGEFAHRGSFRNLLGERHDELVDSVSLENFVTEKTPPTFLWHTWEDDTVPVENSLLLALALRKAHVPCEMHIYQKGGHGLSLGSDEVDRGDGYHVHPAIQQWIDMAARWLKDL